MEELPPDIVTNIFSRFKEFRSIGQFRCVCKLWHSILSDVSTLTHLSKNTPNLLLRSRDSYNLSEFRLFYIQDSKEALNPKPLHPFRLVDVSFLDEYLNINYACIAGSCNGFICLITVSPGMGSLGRPQNPIYMFNPITQQRFQLPPCTFPQFDPYVIGYKWFSGFGFDDSMHVYKFALIFARSDDKYSEVCVHTLGSSSTGWRRKLGIVPSCLLRCDEVASPAFVNGAFHWMTFHKTTPIVSFNLGAENFGFVQPPYPIIFGYEQQHKQLAVLENNLSVVDLSNRHWKTEINVWVMKEYNVRESWVKQFSIERQVLRCIHVLKLIKLCKNGELLLLCGGNLVGYDTVSQRVRYLWTDKNSWYQLQLHPLVGSLISVKEAFGMDCEMKRTTSMKRKR